MGYQLNRPTTARALADALGLAWKGADQRVLAVASLQDGASGDLVFMKAASAASVVDGCTVIVPQVPDQANGGCAWILSDNPRLTFIKALEVLSRICGFVSPSQAPQVDPAARLGRNVVLERGVVVGAGTVIEHNVVINAGVRIGRDCLIRGGAQIGGDGFGFEREPDGTPIKFTHLGTVVIGDRVEIGANTCIARGTLGDTVIEDDAKIDNLVHIAHNVKVRRGAFVIACAEVSGGCEVGEYSWVGPNASMIQKTRIGRGGTVGIGAVLTKDVTAQQTVAGNPAQDMADFLKVRAALKKLVT